MTPELATLPLPLARLLFGTVFVFGLLWGSFLNVVIHRLPLGESVITPRSRCPGCRGLIRWYENIPVLSWLALRARCARCGTRISVRYPLVELLTGSLFLAAALWRPEPLAWPFHFWFLAALVACTFIDIDHWILPDRITLPGIGIGLLGAFLVPDSTLAGGWVQALLEPTIGSAFSLHVAGLVHSLFGVLLGGGILYSVAWGYQVFAHKDGLGGGDIKFLAMIGAFLGAQGALATLVLSSLLGSLLGIFLIALRGKKGGTAIQFGPFLALGAVAAFFFGAPLWQWYFGVQ